MKPQRYKRFVLEFPIKIIPENIRHISKLTFLIEKTIEIFFLKSITISRLGYSKSNNFIKFVVVSSVFYFIKFSIVTLLLFCDIKNCFSVNNQWPMKLLNIIGFPLCHDKKQSLLSVSIYSVFVICNLILMRSTLDACRSNCYYQHIAEPRQYRFKSSIRIKKYISDMIEENKRVFHKQMSVSSKYYQSLLTKAYLDCRKNIEKLKQDRKQLLFESSISTCFARLEEISIIILSLVGLTFVMVLFLYVVFIKRDSSFLNPSPSNTTITTEIVNSCDYITAEIILHSFIVINPFVSAGFLALLATLSHFVRLKGLEVKIDKYINDVEYVCHSCKQESFIIIGDPNIIARNQQQLLFIYFQILIYQNESRSLFKMLSHYLTSISSVLICQIACLLLLYKFSLYPSRQIKEAMFYIIIMNFTSVLYTKYNQAYERFMMNKLLALLIHSDHFVECVVSNLRKNRMNLKASDHQIDERSLQTISKSNLAIYHDFETQHPSILNPFLTVHWRKRLRNYQIDKKVFAARIMNVPLSFNMLMKVSNNCSFIVSVFKVNNRTNII